MRQFIWDIISISSHLERIRSIWADKLGITCPQWLILMAINDLDPGGGISVRDVSAQLHVDPSFVTTQTKALEKAGFLRREASREDARVVLMSLTRTAHTRINALYEMQSESNDIIFEGYKERTLRDFTDELNSIKSRIARASLLIAAEG